MLSAAFLSIGSVRTAFALVEVQTPSPDHWRARADSEDLARLGAPTARECSP